MTKPPSVWLFGDITLMKDFSLLIVDAFYLVSTMSLFFVCVGLFFGDEELVPICYQKALSLDAFTRYRFIITDWSQQAFFKNSKYRRLGHKCQLLGLGDV